MSELNLNEISNHLLDEFKKTGHIQHPEALLEAFSSICLDADLDTDAARLVRLNVFGDLSTWMEFSLLEKTKGNNPVPDFARHLRKAFLAHCREMSMNPETAIQMAIELACSLMDIAITFRKAVASSKTNEIQYSEVV